MRSIIARNEKEDQDHLSVESDTDLSRAAEASGQVAAAEKIFSEQEH